MVAFGHFYMCSKIFKDILAYWIAFLSFSFDFSLLRYMLSSWNVGALSLLG